MPAAKRQKIERTRPSKIERLNPSITSLVEEVGGNLYYRAGAYWLGPWDLQLTYEMDNRGGRNVPLHDQAKANLAEEILRGILVDREQPAWGTPRERALRVLAGLRDETIPAFRPMHFCYWRHGSMDQGIAWSSRFRRDLTIELVGKERLEEADAFEIRDAPSWPEALSLLQSAIDSRWP